MSIGLYIQSVLALVAVLALLAVCGWLARRYGVAGRALGARGQRRLSVVEVAPIDGKRRLVLLRRDATEHLVLLGSDSATVIERGIAPPQAAPGFAAMVEGTNR